MGGKLSKKIEMAVLSKSRKSRLPGKYCRRKCYVQIQEQLPAQIRHAAMQTTDILESCVTSRH